MSEPIDRLHAHFRDRYRVERQLGEGATATVYLATELRYSRSVAIKVMKPQLTAAVGAERFFREIRITAQLTHPRIVPLLDSGQADGLYYLVMPYIDGESLRQRLQRAKHLPIDEALAIASHVASALDHAHRLRIFHRDIKPENILLQNGETFVADFGLALALTVAGGTRLTESGISVGTPLYMSPEQATGERPPDARSDVYSLGCVVYEMLGGEPPLGGRTFQAHVARLLTEAPTPLSILRDTVPRAVNAAVMKALAKVPADRFASAGEFASALTAVGRPFSPGTSGGDQAGQPNTPRRRPQTIIIAGLLGLVIAGAALVGRFEMISHRTSTEPLIFTVPPPAGVEFTQQLRDVSAISPDGREIVFVGTDSTGKRSLWVLSLSERSAKRIPGTEFVSSAFWSPDGKKIGFFRDRRMVISDRASGTSKALVPTSLDVRGASWGDDGTILFAPASQSGIFATSQASATSRQLTRPDRRRGEVGHVWPQILPGDQSFLYYVTSEIDSVRGIYVASLNSSQRRRLVGSSARAVYADGRLLYLREGSLVAQPFDLRTLALSGTPTLVADSVAASFEYYGVFSASRNGRLIYASGRSRDISKLQWFDSLGSVLGSPFPEAGYLRNPHLSADGRFLAFESYRESDSDLRIVELLTGASTLLRGYHALVPVLSPDGSSVTFVEERPGEWTIFRKVINSSDAPEPLWSSPRYTVLTDWSPDGTTLLLTERTEEGDFDLVGLNISSRRRVLIEGGPKHQGSGRFSRDGRHLAYVSHESGEPQIYVEPYPSTGSRCQVSSQGGLQPVWGPADGRLYYLGLEGTVMSVVLKQTNRNLCASTAPRALFRTAIRDPATARSHLEVSPIDGKFLLTAPSIAGNSAWLTVIVNWRAAIDVRP